MIGRKRKRKAVSQDAALEARVERAREQLRHEKAQRSHVDSLVTRLKRHLEENHFGERLYTQMLDSRREP